MGRDQIRPGNLQKKGYENVGEIPVFQGTEPLVESLAVLVPPGQPPQLTLLTQKGQGEHPKDQDSDGRLVYDLG